MVVKKVFLVSAVLLSLGCGNSRASTAKKEALHVELVCKSGDLARCDPATRAAAVKTWGPEVIQQPGSSITLWSWTQTPGSGPSSELIFRAVVPQKWGPGVLAKKAAFLRTVLSRATSTQPLSPEDRHYPAGSTSEMRSTNTKVIVVNETGSQLLSEVPRPSAVNQVVICDRSTSAIDSCRKADVLRLYERWTSQATVGSSFSVLVPSESRAETQKLFSVTVPSHLSTRGAVVAFLFAAQSELVSAWTHLGKLGSAILESISVAIEALEQQNGTCSIIILSDLRQYTPRRWDFEQSVPEAQSFVRWAKQEALLHKVKSGVSLCVEGLHYKTGSGSHHAWTAKSEHRLARLWRAVFAEIGWKNLAIPGHCSD